MHQTAFDNIKTAIAKDVVLPYPDYSQGFEIYIDSSKFQLGAVVTQKNRLLAFFSRKLNTVQSAAKIQRDQTRTTGHSGNTKRVQRHAMGSNYQVYTDHKNLMQDALGLTAD